MERQFFSARNLLLLSGFLVFGPAVVAAQPAPSRTAIAPNSQQGIYLVFPFENAGASPRLDWLG
jgi:hypothetical protein